MAGEQQTVPRDFLGLGMRISEWNKEVTLQQLLSLKNFKEESFVEKRAQNLSDQLVPHRLHPSLMQDIVKSGQGIVSCSQGFNLDHSALGDCGDNGGTKPETMLSLSVSKSNEKVLSAPVLRAQPVIANSTMLGLVGKFSFPGSVLTIPVVGGLPAGTQTRDPSGKQTSAQLTIFYAGNVNVYDDISIEKATEIMSFAGSGSSWPTRKVNSPSGQVPPIGLSNAVMSHGGLGSPQVGHQISGNRQEKLQLNVQTGQPVGNAHPVTGQAGLISPANQHPECSKANTSLATSSALPSGQPVVPRALPQARKASLARFLEKRKERVRSKSPYLMKNPSSDQLLPEERFSSSNYDAISRTSLDECVDKKAMPMPFGMEELTGALEATSTCDMDAIEETRLSSTGSLIVAECEVAD